LNLESDFLFVVLSFARPERKIDTLQYLNYLLSFSQPLKYKSLINSRLENFLDRGLFFQHFIYLCVIPKFFIIAKYSLPFYRSGAGFVKLSVDGTN